MTKKRAAPKKKARHGLVDRSGTWLVEPTWDDVQTTPSGPMPIRQGRLWGFVERSGAPLIEPRFADTGTFASSSLAAAQCAETELWGYVDRSGAWTIAPRWLHVRPFVDGLAGVCDADEKWGVVDEAGELVAPHTYDGLTTFASGFAGFNRGGTDLGGVVTVGGLWGILDRHGTERVAPRFETLVGFDTGGQSVATEAGHQVIIDTAGEVLWRGDEGVCLWPPRAGRAWIHGGEIVGQRLLDEAFEVIAERRDVVSALAFGDDGRAAVNIGGELIYSQAKGGKWGFVDRCGETVVAAEYTAVEGYFAGSAAVRDKRGWFAIDLAGGAVHGALRFAEIYPMSDEVWVAKA